MALETPPPKKKRENVMKNFHFLDPFSSDCLGQMMDHIIDGGTKMFGGEICFFISTARAFVVITVYPSIRHPFTYPYFFSNLHQPTPIAF